MQGSASLFDEGRFGPVYRSHDPATNQPVLVRTFAQPLTPAEQGRLVEALARLCDSPLDHPSIARPLVAGIDEGRPFLIHTLLPGVSLQRFLEERGPQPFPDVVLRVTQLAAAIDFAAAAGVHHGDLGMRDIILDAESTGISGVGVMQALEDAGIASQSPTQTTDVQALARMAFQLLTGRPFDDARDLHGLAAEGANTARLRRVLASALSDRPEERPQTALAFAAALQEAIAEVPASEAPSRQVVSPPVVPAPAPGGIADLPLRPGHEADGMMRAMEPNLPIDSAPIERTSAPSFGDDLHAGHSEPVIRPAYTATLPLSAAHAAAPREPESQGGWLLVAAALAIGILAGFTGGFIVGQRSDVPIPQFAADLIDRVESSGGQEAADALQESTPGAAGTATEPRRPSAGAASGVPDTGALTVQAPDITSRELGAGSSSASPAVAGSAARPAPPAVPPANAAGASDGPASSAAEAAADARPRPATPDPGPSIAEQQAADTASRGPAGVSREQAPAPRVSPDTPGGLQVLSRPEGAQVFVDGALIGRTPLLIPSVDAGTHDVRIELAGHRRWATRVRVEPGERSRVAASLEQ